MCNYGPAANIWKDPVYTVANSTCDCPCVDCDQAAGMCPANPRLMQLFFDNLLLRGFLCLFYFFSKVKRKG